MMDVKREVEYTSDRTVDEGIVIAEYGDQRTESRIIKGADVVYNCGICNKNYETSESVDQHVKSHIDGRMSGHTVRFMCPVCNGSFANYSQLKAHKTTEHSHQAEEERSSHNEREQFRTGPFNCDICSKTFSSRTQHIKHMDMHQMTYDCEICSEQMPSDSKCVEHVIMHFLEGLFDCETCEKQFTDLRSHISTHLLDQPYQCAVCRKKFGQRSELNVHVKKYHSFVCERCNEYFVDDNHLRDHMKVHKSDKLFECDVCNKTFLIADYLKNHRKSHIEEFSAELVSSPNSLDDMEEVDNEPLHEICLTTEPDQCAEELNENDPLEHQHGHPQHDDYHSNGDQLETSQMKDDLTEKDILLDGRLIIQIKEESSCTSDCSEIINKNKNHSTNGQFSIQCKLCYKVYPSITKYKHHVATRHPENGAFRCETCGKTFSHRGNLQRHVQNIHTASKSYKCKLCGKRFTKLYDFNIHKREHSHGDETLHTCDTCGMAYIHKKSLIIHLRKHTNERPYKCLTCGKDYRESSSLLLHIKMNHPTYTSMNFHVCSKCNRRFRMWRSLVKHIIHTHSNDQINENIPIECQLCKKVFTNKSGLTGHMLTHLDDKTFGRQKALRINFQSGKCNKILSSHSELIKHKATHTEQHTEEVDRNDELDKQMNASSREHETRCTTNEKQFGNFSDSEHTEQVEYSDELDMQMNISNREHETKSTTNEKQFSNSSDSEHTEGVDYKNELNMQMNISNREHETKSTTNEKQFSNSSDSEDTKSNSHKRENCERVKQVKRMKNIKLMKCNKINSIECRVCDEVYSVISEYTKHVMTQHPGTSPFICRDCGKTFNFHQNLLSHVRHKCMKQVQNKKNRSMKCRVCDEVYSVISEYTKHVMTQHPGTSPFICRDCGKTFNFHQNLLSHVRHKCIKQVQNKKNRSMKCRVCDEVYSVISEYTKHVMTQHPGTSPFICRDCGKTFNFHQNLLSHVKHKCTKQVQNKGIKSMKCRVCDEFLFGKSEYTKHVMTQHPGTSPFSCENCDKTFSSHQGLLSHIRKCMKSDLNRLSNTNERFACFACGKIFLSQRKLMDHDIEEHSVQVKNEVTRKRGKRYYELKCRLCDEVYFNMVKYVVHVKNRHPGTSPFICEVCGKTFGTYKNLLNHMSSSMCGGQLYKCEFCVITCTSLYNREEHVKRVHCRTMEQFVCDTCNNIFSSLNELIKHKATHTEQHTEKVDCNDELNKQMNASSREHETKSTTNERQFSNLSESEHTESNLHKHENCERFKCPTCGIRYNNVYQLIKHKATHGVHHTNDNQMKTHSNRIKSMKCRVCDEFIFGKSKYKEHVVTQHPGTSPFICEGCGKTFNFHQSLLSHVRRRCMQIESNQFRNKDFTNNSELTDEKTFRRQKSLRNSLLQPGRCAKIKEKLKKHTSDVHNETDVEQDLGITEPDKNTPVECEICKTEFTDVYELSDHLLIHLNDEKKMKCGTCGEAFILNVYLQRHVEKNPKCTVGSVRSKNEISKNKNAVYTCALCNLRLFTPGGYVTHVKAHTGVLSCVCHICGRTFFNIHNLNTHMIVHRTDRPYICTVCGKDFRQPASYKIHMRQHTGERPYKCDVCDKKFIQNVQLKFHMLQHTGERPYKCGTCDKAFRSGGKLKDHLKTHITERPFSCELCEKTYINSGNLGSHMRTAHSYINTLECNICGFRLKNSIGLLIHMKKHKTHTT